MSPLYNPTESHKLERSRQSSVSDWIISYLSAIVLLPEVGSGGAERHLAYGARSQFHSPAQVSQRAHEVEASRSEPSAREQPTF